MCTVASWPMRVLYFCSTHFMSSPLWSPCLINFIKASRNGTDHYSFPQPIRILFICCIDFTLILKLYNCALCTAEQQSALSLVGAKVLKLAVPCLDAVVQAQLSFSIFDATLSPVCSYLFRYPNENLKWSENGRNGRPMFWVAKCNQDPRSCQRKTNKVRQRIQIF